jgi:hypothetical protein
MAAKFSCRYFVNGRLLPSCLQRLHCHTHETDGDHCNQAKGGAPFWFWPQFTQGSKHRFLHLNEDGLLSCAKRLGRLQQSVNDD